MHRRTGYGDRTYNIEARKKKVDGNKGRLSARGTLLRNNKRGGRKIKKSATITVPPRRGPRQLVPIIPYRSTSRTQYNTIHLASFSLRVLRAFLFVFIRDRVK